MSKEKLAKIKNKVEKNYKVSKQVARLIKDNSDAKDLSCWLDYKSINYLIKQAERSIDYDNKLISIEDNKQYVSELLEQNKRYREALELIKLKTLDIKGNKDTRPFQIYGIASEALEVENE